MMAGCGLPSPLSPVGIPGQGGQARKGGRRRINVTERTVHEDGALLPVIFLLTDRIGKAF